MTENTNAELLMLSSIEPDNPECVAAFNKFFMQLKDFVWNACVIKAKMLDSNKIDQIAEVLFQNTFIDVSKNAGKFEIKTENHQLDIHRWLCGIIKNKGKQYLQENNKDKDHIVFLEIVPDIPEKEIELEEQKFVSFEREILNRALQTLNEKERSVLLLWWEYSIDGTTQNIDKEIKENLAKQFNVKPDSLKQIAKRSLEKVIKYIKDNQVKRA
jgi:RNA polymerase sigma factor (sigma-70 family)